MRRIIFDYRPAPVHLSPGRHEPLPHGFTVWRINKNIAEQLQRDLIAAGNQPWFDAIWGGIEPFLESGFGFVILYDGDIVSNCRSSSVENGVAAIQVSTRMKYRKMNLATVVCSAFIEHCVALGIEPEYSCLEENAASAALGAKLGFIPSRVVEDTY